MLGAGTGVVIMVGAAFAPVVSALWTAPVRIAWGLAVAPGAGLFGYAVLAPERLDDSRTPRGTSRTWRRAHRSKRPRVGRSSAH